MTEQLALIESKPEPIEFRPIHYLGNKSRLLDAIESVVESLGKPNRPVCDLFTGSGVVAQRLGRRRDIFASDIQEYARVLTSALLSPSLFPDDLGSALLSTARSHQQELESNGLRSLVSYERAALRDALKQRPSALCDVLEYGSILRYQVEPSGTPAELAKCLQDATNVPTGANTVTTRYYGGVYFSYEQASAIDGLALAVRELPPRFRDTGLAALLSTVSEVASTVGNQFAQPIRPRSRNGRPKERLIRAVAANRTQKLVFPTYRSWLRRYQSLPVSHARHTVIRADFRDALADLPDAVAAIYADPPYTRDHYSRFYHVLETISLGDEPRISTVKIGGRTTLSRALYRLERHQSPFCVKTQVEGAFNDLFAASAQRGVPIIVSYSPYSAGTAARPLTRVIGTAGLMDLATEHFSKVQVTSAGRVAHSKLNVERLNAEVSYNAEVFLIAIP